MKKKNKEKTKKTKKKEEDNSAFHCFTMDLHSETLSSFSLLSINKLN